MQFNTVEVSQAMVVVPEGDLDVSAATTMKQMLEALLDKGTTRLVLDLGRVSYLDSAVWGELVRAAKRSREAGGELRLCAMGGDLLVTFTLLRLASVMPLYPTRERAVESLTDVMTYGQGPLAHHSPFLKAGAARTAGSPKELERQAPARADIT